MYGVVQAAMSALQQAQAGSAMSWLAESWSVSIPGCPSATLPGLCFRLSQLLSESVRTFRRSHKETPFSGKFFGTNLLVLPPTDLSS